MVEGPGEGGGGTRFSDDAQSMQSIYCISLVITDVRE